MGREFTRGDRVIYLATYTWTLGWFAFFVIGTVHNLAHPVEDAWWERFWKVYVILQAALAVFVTVWMGLGGARDLRRMLRRLKSTGRREDDDGYVR